MQADGSRMHRSSRRLEIPVTETVYGGMTRAELSEAQAQELHLEDHDRMVERTKDKKNAVEAFVYEMRNKVWLLRNFHLYHLLWNHFLLTDRLSACRRMDCAIGY